VSFISLDVAPFSGSKCEALSIAEAALIAGRSVRTIRDWCARLDIGRRIGGQWAVSHVALAMYLDGDREVLGAYLRGDRSSTSVLAYFERCGVPVSKSTDSFGRA
jgi:Helix-turn-helix domain